MFHLTHHGQFQECVRFRKTISLGPCFYRLNEFMSRCIEHVLLFSAGTIFVWGMGSTKQLGQGDDEDDIFEPLALKGKQLENKLVLQFCSKLC